MSDLRKKRAPGIPRVTAQGLKIFSAVILLLVNGGEILLEKGMIRLDSYTQAQLLAAMDTEACLTGLVGAASLLGLLRGLAVPIFAFLLAEGFLHTGSYGKYLGRVAVTALISELAFDFAMTGKLLEFSRQNPMLGLTVALIMLYILRLPEHMAAVERVILRILTVLCAAFWVMLLRVDCGLETVLLAAVFYCFHQHNAVKIILGVLISLLDPLGPMAFCGIGLYNGERRIGRSQYGYYVIYPLQLLVMGVVARCFLV